MTFLVDTKLHSDEIWRILNELGIGAKIFLLNEIVIWLLLLPVVAISIYAVFLLRRMPTQKKVYMGLAFCLGADLLGKSVWFATNFTDVPSRYVHLRQGLELIGLAIMNWLLISAVRGVKNGEG